MQGINLTCTKVTLSAKPACILFTIHSYIHLSLYLYALLLITLLPLHLQHMILHFIRGNTGLVVHTVFPNTLQLKSSRMNLNINS